MNKKIQVQQVVYKVFYQGKQFALPLFVLTGTAPREKVRVRSSKPSAKR